MTPAGRIVLGIDPGTALMGYGLLAEEAGEARLVAYGALKTSPAIPPPERLRELYQGLLGLVRRYKPVEMAVERLYFGRNSRTALAVGQACGVVMLAAAMRSLPLSEYTPKQVKSAVAGYGNASKSQIQQMLRLVLGLQAEPQPDDAADALAVALCHLRWSQHEMIVQAALDGQAP